MNVKYISLVLLILISGVTFSQEYLTGIQVNEEVAAKSIQQQKHQSGLKNQRADAITLPFVDDFSVSNVLPNQAKWEDNFVYINQRFAVSPPNIGVATFDVLDAKGVVYEDAQWNPSVIADYLTSVRIRTDSLFKPFPRKLTPADSIYISFFYQPQGRGDDPESRDTLLLQLAYRTGDTVFSHMDSINVKVNGLYVMTPNDTVFPGDTLWAPPGCNPNVFTITYVRLVWDDWVTVACDSVMMPEIKWRTVWKTEGMKLSEFKEKYGRDFAQVMVPITDPIFFYDEFQFRFLNYASIAGETYPSWGSNVDIWNIDYVYLNYNRDKADTNYRVLSFSESAPSFLRYYQSMPYRQYRADISNSQARTVEMYITNLDAVEHNTKYSYKAEQVGGSNSFSYNGGSCNLLPFYEGGFQDCNSCKPHACPDVVQYFALEYDVDTMSYWITHYISDSSNVNSIVDSVKFHQGFYNYYAYDDGTPEVGYNLVSAGAKMAYQFQVNVPDTLQGVQIYFNRTKNASQLYFSLKVWRDNNGQPGQEIYSQENMKVEWESGWPYKFYYYELDKPMVVTGTFYIGIEQYDEAGLNVGFDLNNDEHERIFYTYYDEWIPSDKHGALLIRPVVGASGFLNTEEHNNISQKINVYPNPAGSSFRFDQSLRSDKTGGKIVIYNIMGAKVKEQNLHTTLVNVNDLPEGLYVVKILSGGNSYVAKLIIRH